jgi:cyclin B
MLTARRKPFGDVGNVQGAQHLLSARGEIKPKPGEPQLKYRVGTSIAPPSPRSDERFRSDPLYMVDTCKEIYENFQKAETKRRPATTYMTLVQTDVNEKMRAILVDWLVDVHLKFKLLPETLFLSAEIIDRFLDKKVVNRNKLQLVGVVGMLLAAKYEEIYPPEVKDFIYISANTYSRDDILRMERLVFQTLDFNITVPTVYVFLKRGLQVCEADAKMCHTAQYFAELTMLDYQMLNYLPSLVAASCIYLAHKALEARECWGPALEHYLGYRLPDLEVCAAAVLALARAAPTQKTQAVRKKYAYARYYEVSKAVAVEHIQLP